MLSGFRGGLIQAVDGLGGRFADEALWVEPKGAVEGFLAGGMDGVGLPVTGAENDGRPSSSRVA